MQYNSSLINQLATKGISLPSWPEEPEDGAAADNWIQRGNSYAEGVRLWRAQLRNNRHLDRETAMDLVSDIHTTSEISEWDQRVIHYILAGLQDPYGYEVVTSAIRLVEPEGLTIAQLLGASLDLISTSFIVTGLLGIERVLKSTNSKDADEIRIVSLLINTIPPIPRDIAADLGRWKQSITFHLEAVRLLLKACDSYKGNNESRLIPLLGRLSEASWDQSREISGSRQHCITSINEKAPLIAGMASVGSRRELLRVSLESVLPQVDRVELVLNGYGEVPEWLMDQKITVITDAEVGDHADNGKFLGIKNHMECIYFSVDDDILYPKDYVERLLDAISHYGGDAAVGVHGSLVHSQESPFLNRRTHAFWKRLAHDMPCSYVGTGTLALRRSIMPHSPSLIFPKTGASDLFVARYLKLHKTPVVCIRRPEGWLRDLPNISGPTLWKKAQKDHAMQDALLRDSGPWGIVDLMERCQGRILESLERDIAIGLEAAFLVTAGRSLSQPVGETLRFSCQAQMAFRFYTGNNYTIDYRAEES